MKAGQPPPPPGPNSGPPCGYTWSSAIYSGGIPLSQLAGMLDWVAGRVIVDRTGLPGRYEFTLRFASPTTPPSDAPDAPPVLFTALQEQLGLRLDAVRAPIDTLVIDHIERPDEN
jgi:bla regulator protein BlaR1